MVSHDIGVFLAKFHGFRLAVFLAKITIIQISFYGDSGAHKLGYKEKSYLFSATGLESYFFESCFSFQTILGRILELGWFEEVQNKNKFELLSHRATLWSPLWHSVWVKPIWMPK